VGSHRAVPSPRDGSVQSNAQVMQAGPTNSAVLLFCSMRRERAHEISGELLRSLKL
jgi:hypothetical protein